jgi:hypothetical protein
MQIIYKYIVCILLFTCFGFTQDTLRTKQGKQYLGEIIDLDSKSVEFSHSGWDSPKRFYLNGAEVFLGPKIPTRERIIELKADSNAELIPMGKWYFYFPAIGTLFVGSHILDIVFDEIGIYPDRQDNKKYFFPLSISSGFYISKNIYKNFYLENKNEIKYPESILTESDKILYKDFYKKTIKRRKIMKTLTCATPFIIIVGASIIDIANSWGDFLS